MSFWNCCWSGVPLLLLLPVVVEVGDSAAAAPERSPADCRKLKICNSSSREGEQQK
jgi:hypothetical protein